MKKYQSVIDKVHEYRYKKGIVRTDDKGSLYKGSKILYIISFAWLAVFQVIYILGSALLLADGSLADNALELFYSVAGSMTVLILALVLLCLKQHIIPLVLNVLSPLVVMSAYYRNENVYMGFLENGLLSKYFWFHFAPSIFIILFSTIVCIVGIKTKLDFKRDYKKVMESMFIKFSEEHPNATDDDWYNYLEKGENNGNA